MAVYAISFVTFGLNMDYHISSQAGLQSKESDIKLRDNLKQCNVKSVKILQYIPESILEKALFSMLFKLHSEKGCKNHLQIQDD